MLTLSQETKTHVFIGKDIRIDNSERLTIERQKKQKVSGLLSVSVHLKNNGPSKMETFSSCNYAFPLLFNMSSTSAPKLNWNDELITRLQSH